MHNILHTLFLASYAIPALLLMVFGLNLYLMTFLFLRKRKQALRDHKQLMAQFDSLEQKDWPRVVTQLPVYNEYNVIDRCMRATAEMEYPEGLHTIQILDDSNDQTRELIDRTAAELRKKGHLIEVVRRDDRVGYKAGALDYGMEQNDADFFAIFDADFIPTKDFLIKTMLVMMSEEKVGLVQARWGHINTNDSLLTRAQAIGIDGHFTIEQPARAWNKLFMNFNGTAGIWRRSAIEDAGGWEHDTLTEDMDLSYRSQLADWKPYFIWDLVVPAEIPDNINAFKSQQFRWAKGSMETAIKLLPRTLKSKKSLFSKIQSVLHTTHYIIHPIMLWLAIMAFPVMALGQVGGYTKELILFWTAILLSSIAPSFMYSVSQSTLYKGGWKKIIIIPFLSMIGIGIAVSNASAIFEALRGKKSAFIRTPKKGDRSTVRYAVKMPYLALIELALGIYCFTTFIYYLRAEKFFVIPFVLLYAGGFLCVGTLSLKQAIDESGILNRRDNSDSATGVLVVE